MKDFSRYEIAQVIADEFDLIVSDIVVGGMKDFKKDFEAEGHDMAGLGIRLETAFGIEIPPDTETNWRTVDDVYRYFESQVVTA